MEMLAARNMGNPMQKVWQAFGLEFVEPWNLRNVFEIGEIYCWEKWSEFGIGDRDMPVYSDLRLEVGG